MRVPAVMPHGSPWPRVSIVTPSYNQGQFLEKTIRSVLLQGYPDLEYIIIDGSSTDGSVDIIRRYEPWLTYWVSEPDRGQCHAINKGFARATGQVLAWLNSDDVYRPGTIFRAVQALLDSGAGLVYSRCRMVAPDGCLLAMYEPAVPVTWRSLIMVWMHGYPNPPQPSVFFRRVVLDRAGRLDESLHYALDYEYWLRALQYSDFHFVDDVWADYLVHASSKTGQGWQPFARETFLAGRRYWHRLNWKDRLLCHTVGWHLTQARHYLNDAYDDHSSGQLAGARRNLLKALRHNPCYLLNRGTLSFCRKLLRGTHPL